MEQNKKIDPQEAYEKYKLMWMLAHGYSLKDLIKELQDALDESDEDLSLQSIFEDWEFGIGFGSEIWPCYNEFLETEYKQCF